MECVRTNKKLDSSDKFWSVRELLTRHTDRAVTRHRTSCDTNALNEDATQIPVTQMMAARNSNTSLHTRGMSVTCRMTANTVTLAESVKSLSLSTGSLQVMQHCCLNAGYAAQLCTGKNFLQSYTVWSNDECYAAADCSNAEHLHDHNLGLQDRLSLRLEPIGRRPAQPPCMHGRDV